MPLPPLEWSPASALDSDFFWLLMSQWLPPNDTILNPTVSVVAITGDSNPLSVVPDSVIVDTGPRLVSISPGTWTTDPGPRIQVQLAGGSKGQTYTTLIGWQNRQGRTKSRPALLFIQWDATG